MTAPLQVQFCMGGFLYTVVQRDLSDSGITKVSRNRMDQSTPVSSTVNSMHGLILMMCSRTMSIVC